MKKKRKSLWPLFLLGALIIIAIGYKIYRKPYDEAKKRNECEERLIDAYVNDQPETDGDQGGGMDEVEEGAAALNTYQFSDVGEYTFQGKIDCILVADKINLKKAIIRGNTLDDNNFNLSQYYFVTADLTSTLNDNYAIYGHSSQTYGHSFNRLDEIGVGDGFYILQGKRKYDYRVESVDRVLRSKGESFLPGLKKRVTLISCEKFLSAGYAQKRVIIVRAVQIEEGATS